MDLPTHTTIDAPPNTLNTLTNRLLCISSILLGRYGRELARFTPSPIFLYSAASPTIGEGMAASVTCSFTHSKYSGNVTPCTTIGMNPCLFVLVRVFILTSILHILEQTMSYSCEPAFSWMDATI